MTVDAYEQMLRADRAEHALRDANTKLARILQMADSWESRWGETGIRADVAAAAIRRTVREIEVPS
jgi:hypothetical protein